MHASLMSWSSMTMLVLATNSRCVSLRGDTRRGKSACTGTVFVLILFVFYLVAEAWPHF
ncbi:hypothetical protein M758_8G187100 [Ceratodon purpureus]|nr:hypothetical protein M758_8G187100 [Ceratodon purpureus]